MLGILSNENPYLKLKPLKQQANQNIGHTTYHYSHPTFLTVALHYL